MNAGTITSGTASFTTTSPNSYDTSPTADLLFPGTQDNLFELGWWFRLAGGTTESIFGLPTSEVAAGNVQTVTWTSIGSTAIGASLVQTLTQSGTTATLNNMLTLVNNDPNGRDLTLDLFHMADIDLAGAAGDTASGGLGGITVLDGATGRAMLFTGSSANAFLVRPFGGTSLRSVLNDAFVTNFDNSGLPFGPGDVTIGFQWTTFTLPFGPQGLTFNSQLAMDTQPGVPEPASMLLLSTGLAVMWVLRRKRVPRR